MSARRFLEGCGIGIALTLSYIWQPLTPAHIQGLYLRVLPVSSVAGGAALDLIAASLLCWGALTLLERVARSRTEVAWALLIAVVAAVVLHSALQLAEVNFPVPSTLKIAAVLLLAAMVAWRFWPAGYVRLVAAFRMSCVCAGLCIAWILPELAYGAMHREMPDVMQTQRPLSVAAADAGQTRIVWLLLDELSYDQTFDHRQPDLKLDNFDALRSVSTTFNNVQPAGYLTDEILPALLSGRPVVAIESSMNGALLVKSGGRWERLDPEATIFGDAERLGWSTGIVGWFNPYCRLFGAVVDRCAWEPESRMFPGHMSASNSAWENALAPLSAKFHVAGDTRMGAEHNNAYLVLTERALEMVRDGRDRLVFVHLPVPHPPGIYNRVSGRMRIGGSYLDNLVLADKTVGAVRAAIDNSASAGRTILIVSSDHSMRVPKWRGSASWTVEDERVFGKRFDTRPVLMVHFAGQKTGQTVSAPFAELQTHRIIDAMLQEKITDERDLAAWPEAGQ